MHWFCHAFFYFILLRLELGRRRGYYRVTYVTRITR